MVLGRSALEPLAYFVLSGPRGSDSAARRLYHAPSGGSYALSDPSCPLRAVGMLFDGSNVWANVQPADAPAAMSWKLSDGAAWRRLFADGSASAEQVAGWTLSVQLPSPAYARAAEEDKNDLEREIERALRLHIEERR